MPRTGGCMCARMGCLSIIRRSYAVAPLQHRRQVCLGRQVDLVGRTNIQATMLQNQTVTSQTDTFCSGRRVSAVTKPECSLNRLWAWSTRWRSWLKTQTRQIEAGWGRSLTWGRWSVGGDSRDGGKTTDGSHFASHMRWGYTEAVRYTQNIMMARAWRRYRYTSLDGLTR